MISYESGKSVTENERQIPSRHEVLVKLPINSFLANLHVIVSRFSGDISNLEDSGMCKRGSLAGLSYYEFQDR